MGCKYTDIEIRDTMKRADELRVISFEVTEHLYILVVKLPSQNELLGKCQYVYKVCNRLNAADWIITDSLSEIIEEHNKQFMTWLSHHLDIACYQ